MRNVSRSCMLLGASSAIAMLGSMAVSALADGPPRRGKIAEDCCISWTGLYVGAHVGVAAIDVETRQSPNPGFLSQVFAPAINLGWSPDRDVPRRQPAHRRGGRWI